jgi:HSP20 family molecular chaperone IbpA
MGDKIEAVYTNGVLEVNLPKATLVVKSKIAIK